MLHLPKFVRHRLQASVSSVGHPDLDILTAFSERSLPSHERAIVMEHLARCGDCRDVVALALAPTDAVPEPVSAAHRDWFRWPVLRWGAVAAGIVVIAAIGVDRYRERQESLAAFMARNQTAHDRAAQDQIAQNQAPQAEMHDLARAVQPAAPSSERFAAAADHSPAASEKGNPPGAALAPAHGLGRSVAAGSAMHGAVASGVGGDIASGWHDLNPGRGTGRPMNEPAKNLLGPPRSASRQTKPPSLADSVQRPEVPSMSETVEVQSAAPAITTQDQSQGRRQDQQPDLYPAKTQPSSAEQLYAENDKTLSKAKQPTQQAEVSAAAAPLPGSRPQPVTTGRNAVSLSAPTWSITATGGLQRSFDKGKTWQDVILTAGPGPESNFMQTAESWAVYAMARPAEEKAEGKAEEKKDKKKEDAKFAKQMKAVPLLRAVTANGFDVWAGGSAGALYHSVDGGDHWTRVFPLAGSIRLTADITGIQFFDLHGTITTASSETWTTTDGGRSWQRP